MTTSPYRWPPYQRAGTDLSAPFIPPSVLGSGQAMFLLTLSWAGGLYYSTRAVTVPAEAVKGGKLRFHGGLPEFDIELEATPTGDYRAPRVSFAFVPLETEPIKDWVNSGHRLDQAIAELAWWVEGTDWWRREVLVRGRVESGAYGGDGEPLLVTLAPELVRPGEDGRLLPDKITVAGVGSGTYFEDELGKPYPRVFGSPGLGRRLRIDRPGLTLTASRFYPGSRALRWTATGVGGRTVEKLLLCVGHVSKVGPLKIWHDGCEDPADDGSTEVDGDVFELTNDANGVPITLIDLTGTGIGLTPGNRTATDWYVCWRGVPSPSAAYRGDRAKGTGYGSFPPETVTRTITFADSGTVPLGVTLSPGARVIESTVDVGVAFSPGSGANNNVSIGDNLLSTRHAADLPTNAVGTTTESSPDGLVRAKAQLQLDVTSIATVGSADVSVRYQRAGGTPVDSLGDLAMWLLSRSRKRVDLQLWASAMARFRGFEIDAAFQVDPEAGYWGAFRDHVMPLLPITPVWGANGVKPVVWPWQAKKLLNAQYKLTNGKGGIWRAPDVRFLVPAGEIVTDVQVSYAWDPREEVYRHSVRCGPRPDIDLTLLGAMKPSEGSTAGVAIRSRTYPGLRVARLESRVLASQVTAGWWARWYAAIHGGQHIVIDLDCPQEYGCIQIGDTAHYTDETLGLTEERAVCVGRRLTDRGVVTVRLAVLDLAGSRKVSMGPNANSGGRDRTGKPTPQ